MDKLFANRARWLQVLRIFSIWALAAVVAAPTLCQADALPQDQQKQIEVILESLRGPSVVTQSLSRLGFRPGAEGVASETMEGLKNWPDARKLEAAYHMAEAAKTNSGETLLKDIMVMVARRNYSITATETFRKNILNDTAYVQKPGSFTLEDAIHFKPRLYAFKATNTATLLQPLQKELRTVVDIISTHGSHHGKVVQLALICCKIPPKEIYNKLRTSPDYLSVYEWALTKDAPPPTTEAKVNKLIESAVRLNAALAYDDNLKSFVETQRRLGIDTFENKPSSVDGFVRRSPGLEGTATNMAIRTPDEMVSRVVAEVGAQVLPSTVQALAQAVPAVSSGGSSSQKASARLAARQFASFQLGAYQALPPQTNNAEKPRSALRFRAASIQAGGFGGIFLGNKVTWDLDKPAPTWFEWHPINSEVITPYGEEPPEEWGYLFIVMADGSVVTTEPMRAYQMWAAITTVYTGIDGVISPLFVGDGTDGEGVGLAGFTGPKDYFFLKDDIVERRPEGSRTFVVHPAIAGYPLGEDALLVDAYPFNFKDQLRNMVEVSVKRLNNATLVESLEIFYGWIEDDNYATYKFIDVPIYIDQSEAGMIFPARSDSKTYNWPEQLTRQAFLTFQKFESFNGPPEEEDPLFYSSITPLLIDAWPSFSRLNDYAGVLAIVRWLRANDATWKGEVEKLERGATLTNLVIGDKAAPKLEHTLYEAKIDLAEQVYRRAEAIVGQASPAYTKLNKQIHEARLERLATQEAIALYGLETTAPSKFNKLLIAREEFQSWQNIKSMPTQLRRLMMIMKGIDVSGKSDSKLLREVRKQARKKQKVVRAIERQLAQTPEGKFINNLKAYEKAQADKSPLAAGRAMVRQQLVGSIPDSEQVLYRSILNERATLLKERAEIMAIIESLRSIKIQPDTDSESVLLKWVATEQERSSVQAITAQIRSLTNEIDSPNSSLLRRLKAKWDRSDAIEDREKIIHGLTIARLNTKIDLLTKQYHEMNEAAERKANNAEKEMDRLIKTAPVPSFEEWWKLQTSFREQVFSN